MLSHLVSRKGNSSENQTVLPLSHAVLGGEVLTYLEQRFDTRDKLSV